MIRQVLAIIVLLGLGAIGCDRKANETASPPPGEGALQTPGSPTTQPDISVTEPPRAREPAERPSERRMQEGMQPQGTDQGRSGAEQRRDQSGATTAPAGQQAGAGGSSAQRLAAKPLLTAAPAANQESPVSDAAAQDPRLTGSWVSDQQEAAGPVQMTFMMRDNEKLMKWSAEHGSEEETEADESQMLAQGMSADYWFDEQGNLMVQYGPDKRTLQLKPDSPEAEAAASR